MEKGLWVGIRMLESGGKGREDAGPLRWARGEDCVAVRLI